MTKTKSKSKTKTKTIRGEVKIKTRPKNVLQANKRECGHGSTASLLLSTCKTKQSFTANKKGTKERNDRRTGAGGVRAGKDFGQVSILAPIFQLHILFRSIFDQSLLNQCYLGKRLSWRGLVK